MRVLVKMLIALLIAIGLQLLVCAEGGWAEVSFEAQCLVSYWNHDPAFRRHLMEQSERLIVAEREAGMARLAERERRDAGHHAARATSTRPSATVARRRADG